MKRPLLCIFALMTVAYPAEALTLVKSYSYFNTGGRTLDQIQDELTTRGPQVKTTGLRHPGATQMKFTTRVGYSQQPDSCRIVSADVTVKTHVILPRWRPRGKVGPDVRFFWDTLSADIKRHEERHVEIAKNYGRELENALKATWPQKTCEAAAAKARQISAAVLARHDKAQADFDRVELVNFESRILRLMHYRLERMQAARQQQG
ncbi:DUF922 domain-containing Zn-dependent protease [Mesorhizobium sp. SP-1A]|uniref:DUF922 domain-containing Zn-dependent protease n=1 Tax=Mesorhizobium sp. SP-1A TaxID=3077840 RepID=UPI0028F70DA9|nr:DUF922 domain-containing protein [Mesorhizobium sp. SP-1A]